MKIAGIIVATATAIFLFVADQVGNYCQDINPYAPDDYPRGDMGEDFF